MLVGPQHIRDPWAGGTGCRMGTLPAAHPGSPLSHILIWERLCPLLSPLCPPLCCSRPGDGQPQFPGTPSPSLGRRDVLSTHTNASPQLSQAGDLIIEVYLEQKVPDCCVTLKVSPKAGLGRSR